MGNAPPAEILGTVESIGNEMFTSYLLPFEATSVLILMAIVGAMLLARRERDLPVPDVDAGLLEAPREVPLEGAPEHREHAPTGVGHE
jgi:NADH-quinone oxidoreductase subunit J